MQLLLSVDILIFSNAQATTGERSTCGTEGPNLELMGREAITKVTNTNLIASYISEHPKRHVSLAKAYEFMDVCLFLP